MSEKHKKTCKYLNYLEHFLIFISPINCCVSVCAFTSLVAVPVGVTSSAVGLKVCVITAGIKKYKSIIKKKKQKLDRIVFLGKAKLVEGLISKDLVTHILIMTNVFQ